MDVVHVQVDTAPATPVQVQVDETGEQINVLVQDTTETIVVQGTEEKGDPGRPPTPDEVDASVGRYFTEHPPTTRPVERNFATAADTWEWDHALGYTPTVETMAQDRGGIVGRLLYNGPDKTVVTFAYPTAGIMALS